MRIGTSLKIAFATLIIGIIAGGVGGYFIFDINNTVTELSPSCTNDFSLFAVDPVYIPIDSESSFDIKIEGNFESYYIFTCTIYLFELPISEVISNNDYYDSANRIVADIISYKMTFTMTEPSYSYLWLPEVYLEEDIVYALRCVVILKEKVDSEYYKEDVSSYFALGTKPDLPIIKMTFKEFLENYGLVTIGGILVAVSLIVLVFVFSRKYIQYRRWVKNR